MPYSSRDRVRMALNHTEPDRVPTAVGGGPYGIVDEVYLQLVDQLGFGQPVPPFRTGHSISFMDDRLLDALGTDIRYVYPAVLPNSPVNPGKIPGTFIDSYGQPWHHAQPYYYAGPGILSQVKPGDDFEQISPFPDPGDPKWMGGVAERARALHEANEHFVTMRMIASHGPFQTACDLRGTENFLMDMALHPDFAQALLDRIVVFQNGLLSQAMRAGGEFFDMIELPGDDYASNQGLMISPGMFRKFIKPALASFIETIQSYRPALPIMFHSDGLIAALLDDLIEIGIDVIHPLEPLPGVDFAALKRRYGKQVSFLGAIDISHALPGTREDVIAEVRARVEQLGPGGGYILAPANHIQADVSPNNVITLFQAAQEFGVYPIHASR